VSTVNYNFAILLSVSTVNYNFVILLSGVNS